MSEDAATSRERMRRPTWLLVMVLVAALAASVTTIIIVTARQRTPDGTARQAEVLKAGTAVATSFTTYDYRDLERGFSLTENGLTAQFRQNYQETTVELKSVLTKYEATSSSVVKDIGVSSLNGSKATVIAFIDQTLASSETKDPRTDRIRMRLSLKRVDGDWLVDNVTLV